MSEDGQRKWVLINVCKERMPRVSLADLAFRLRDEAIKLSPICFQQARAKIYYKVYYYLKGESELVSKEFLCTAEWWIEEAKPIHWIIAALIAKEKDND